MKAMAAAGATDPAALSGAADPGVTCSALPTGH